MRSARFGLADRIDQDERADMLGMRQRVMPRDSAAHRIADDDHPIDREPPADPLDDIDIGGGAIVLRRARAGQAVAGQIHADEAIARLESLRPRLPGVERGVRAVDQQEHRRIARAGVAQMDAETSAEIDELRRRRAVFGAHRARIGVGAAKGEKSDKQRREDRCRDCSENSCAHRFPLVTPDAVVWRRSPHHYGFARNNKGKGDQASWRASHSSSHLIV